MEKTVFALIAVMCVLSAVTLQAQNNGVVGQGVWFIRVTNTDQSTPASIRLVFMLNREPWTSRAIGSAKGWGTDFVPEEDFLKPGESTEWYDMGDQMTTRIYFAEKKRYVGVHVGALYPKDSKVSTLKLKIEIAKGEDYKNARTITVDESAPNMLRDGVFLHVDPLLPTQSFLISPEDGEILTYEEAAENQLKWAQEATVGLERPYYCWHVTSKILPGGINLANPSKLVQTNLKIADTLGYTNFIMYANRAGDDDRLRGMGYPVQKNLQLSAYTDNHLKEVYPEKKSIGVDKYVELVSFGDEVTVGNLQMPVEEQEKAFIDWLKEKNANPMDYVHAEDVEAASAVSDPDKWDYVKLFRPMNWWRHPEESKKSMQTMAQKPKLVYDSYLFSHMLWIAENRRRTEMVKELYGNDVQTGTNFNSGNMNPFQWLDMFRDGGYTTPWAEDWWWALNAVSPQSWGLVFAVMRRSAEYNDTPMVFYTIPDNEVPADHMLRMNYFAIANQVKHLNHFCLYHQGFATCDYVEYAQSKDKFQAFGRINAAVGKVDKRLYYARVRPAEVAIIFAKPTSVWQEMAAVCDPEQNAPTNVGPEINPYNYTLQQEEMKALSLALKHSGVPVDVIGDDDISSGLIKKYKVVFMIGEQIQRSVVPALEEWVKNGGKLIGTCGGGLLDEYNQPIEEMKALYGAADVTTERTRMTVMTGDILRLNSIVSEKILGAVVAGEDKLPAFLLKQDIRSAGSEVVLKYEDGAVAVTNNKLGKGNAVLCGFMPGLAYVRPALVMTDQGFPWTMPESYPENRREFVLSLIPEFKPVKPVTTGNYLVDATVQDGPYGSIVTLVNFRNEPTTITLSLNSFPEAKKVFSTRKGTLPIKKINGIPTVTMDLDIGDILTVD